MAIIEDKELGAITVSRHARATHIRMRVAPDGTLRASVPLHTPLFLVRRMVNTSRDELQAMLRHARPLITLEDGVEIGKSHSLRIREGTTLKTQRHGLQIILTLPRGITREDPDVQEVARKQIISALRREAKGYLPRRLAYLAQQHGCNYTRLRLSHAAGRWGSCSSTGTISLNIALMKLPLELIDYVIIHELAHTKHMNHSKEFWQCVEQMDPNYTTHRATLKQEAPSI